MPNLINSTFFDTQELSVPNTDQENVLESLNGIITKYEKECLMKLLGYELYKDFIENSTDQRMLDLLNGVEYTLNGKLVYWQGLIHDENLSLIANYIYWFWEASNATHSTGVGTVKSKGAASINISPGEKMLSAWNWMSSEVKSCICFLRNRKIDGVIVYPEFNYVQDKIARNTFRSIGLFI